MTARPEDERVAGTYAWTINVPVAVTEDDKMLGALLEQARAAAVKQGFEPIEGEVLRDVSEMSEMGVAMYASFETGPDTEWWGVPDEIIQAEVEARQAAARNLRCVRFEFPVLGWPDDLRLSALPADAAEVVMRTGVETDQHRRASGFVCGEPRERHDFGSAAERLRDGTVTSATCLKCDRDVPRDELVANAVAERRGERWWE